VLSAREEGVLCTENYGNIFQGPARVSAQANNGGSSREQVLRGSGGGRGFIARVESEGLMHPGRGVNVKDTIDENRGAIRSECTSAGTRDSG
jgi:hypothetical protein